MNDVDEYIVRRLNINSKCVTKEWFVCSGIIVMKERSKYICLYIYKPRGEFLVTDIKMITTIQYIKLV